MCGIDPTKQRNTHEAAAGRHNYQINIWSGGGHDIGSVGGIGSGDDGGRGGGGADDQVLALRLLLLYFEHGHAFEVAMVVVMVVAQ